MIITLKTHRRSLNSIMDVPFLGAWIMFIFALLPAIILIMVGEYLGFNEEILSRGIIQIIAAIYNLILSYFFNIKIGIMFIPCWLLLFLFGILKIFGLI